MHSRSQIRVWGPWSPQFLEHIVVLCLARRHPKQNSVILLKSTFVPPKFWAGYASGRMSPLSFLQRILTKVRGNGFRWGESVGTGEQLPPKQVC